MRHNIGVRFVYKLSIPSCIISVFCLCGNFYSIGINRATSDILVHHFKSFEFFPFGRQTYSLDIFHDVVPF